ncbi:GNAT family protein [Hyphomicrobiales bacterium 4NK60-0047b]
MNNLNNWKTRLKPEPTELNGKFVQLTHYNFDEHSAALWEALGGEKTNQLIRFFPNDRYENSTNFGSWLKEVNETKEFHTMIMLSVKTKEVLGMASYMRCSPENGSVEVGAVAHGPKMARSPLATEAHFILAKYIFEELGYRRYEWKLNNENEASHKAAKRLGFSFEGIFRQHMVAKGKNRDTAWYSMLDNEWPLIKATFESWLDHSNFDKSEKQIKSLIQIRTELAAEN